MTHAPPAAPSAPRPSVWIALVPVVVLVALLAVNVRMFESADNQVALVLATTVASLLAVIVLRRPWSDLEQGLLKSIGMAMQAALILMVCGMLIAAWIEAGVVPLLIVYGLKLISPGAFLVTACLVCCVVSLACGSSWTTAGTVGVALMAIGHTLGLEPGYVAGAVVSGSYFGDKMSPVSDTTNLAPAMAGSTLIEHIRHMIWTVTPALAIALALYAVLGGSHSGGGDALARVQAVIDTLESRFTLSPLLFIPPVIVLGLIVARMPALPALVAGTFSAVLIGYVVQPLPPGGLVVALKSSFASLYSGFPLTLPAVDPASLTPAVEEARSMVGKLLNERGGMKAMLGTVSLILCAMSYGGVMERSGMLGSIADSVLRLVRGTGSLITATIVSCFGVNALASDQYMAIVVPGRMFRSAFLARRLHPKNLSRCLEDSGTLTSALIPWNTCGAQMFAVLGVGATTYAPYAFLNWICPLVSIAYGLTGFTITRISDEEARRYEAA